MRRVVITTSFWLAYVPVGTLAQVIYWTDIGNGKIQRADINVGTGAEELLLIEGLSSPSGIALIGPPATGACCFGNGFCTPQTQEECEAVEGQVYIGDGTECVGDFTCPAVCWNCVCVDGFQDAGQSSVGCVAEEFACDQACVRHGGKDTFQCSLGACAAVPTASEWGLLVMSFLLLAAGIAIVRSRQRCPIEA